VNKVKTNDERLADRILVALQMAIHQEDKDLSEVLKNALEMALTRGSGGRDFVERRDISDDIQKAFEDIDKLKKLS